MDSISDPREIAWRRRQDYHSRLSAIREAFAASYSQAIPDTRREEYYKSKLPLVMEWVTRRSDTEGTDENIPVEDGMEQQTPDEPDTAEEPMQGPVSAPEKPELLVLVETPEGGKNSRVTKQPSSPAPCAPKRRAKSMKENHTPRRKHKQTRIEKHLARVAHNKSSAATPKGVMMLDDNASHPPPEPSSSAPITQVQAPLTSPQPTTRQTRAMRSAPPRIPRTATSSKNPKSKPPQPPSSSTSSAKRYARTKNSTGTRSNSSKKPTGKSHKTKPLHKPVYQTYLQEPYKIDIIFNRFPALYLVSKRHKQRNLNRPAPDTSLDITMLIFRCRKAAARKGSGEGEIKPGKENSIVWAGRNGGAVFLRRNARRCKKDWGGREG